MAKIDENKERTIYKRKGSLVVRKKKPEKSFAEKFDDKLKKNAKKFDKSLGL